jgi:glycine/D-amino acid oxidase-like deaminating enzyme
MGYPVFPGASTYAYATRAERGGAHIRLGRTATLDRHGDEVRGVVVDGRAIACDAVLVAAGPWTPALIDPTGRWAPIYRTWGVVVEVEIETVRRTSWRGRDRRGDRPGGPQAARRRPRRLQPDAAARHGDRRLDLPAARADHSEWVERILSRQRSSCRPSPTRPSAAAERVPGRRAWTGGR